MARTSGTSNSMISGKGEVLPPPLKWAGGKRWQLPHVRKYWERESHRRLVEPFCGGLAVALGLKPERALLNDVNPHLFNFYCWMQRGLRITIDLKYEQAIFYRHRSRFNELLHKGTPTTKEASLFYYFNRTGEFNVPFGKYRKINYKRDFAAYKSAFANWRFSNMRFDRLRLRSDDF